MARGYPDPVGTPKRIGIIVVAYNAVSTLAKVLDRIPVDFIPRITQILICDDASEDETYLVGLGYNRSTAGGSRSRCCGTRGTSGTAAIRRSATTWAIEHDLDIVVLLHADGQYAPELLPEIVAPLERGDADAVFGSRMMTPGGARKGGMPIYKLIGNKVLSTIENRLAGAELSEWHSGYRAYSVAALRDVPFPRQRRRIPLRHPDHHPVPRGREADRGDPDPHVLRRRDLVRERPARTRWTSSRT